MTDLESDINTLRELDILRIQSGKLRDEGIDALLVCSSLFYVGDITDVPSLIDKLRSDVTPETIPISQFVWGQVSPTMTPLLDNPTSTLPQRELALLQELNKILLGDSIYETARFTGVTLRPVTSSLNAQTPTDHLLLYLNRLLLEDTYPTQIAAKGLNKLHDVLNTCTALWRLSSAPLDNLKEPMKILENLSLEVIVNSRLTILLAAEVMEALIAAPSSTFTPPLLYCYYLIIRELYTTDAPDWAVGGARANSNGMVSAYMTRECVRALLSLIRALEDTGNFIAELSETQKRMDQLRRIQTRFSELSTWVVAEEQRLKFALHTTIRTSRHLVFQPFTPPNTPQKIETVIEDIASRLKETTENATKAFEEVLTAIKTIQPESESDDDISKPARMSAGRCIALSALNRGKRATGSILDILTPNRVVQGFY